MTRHATVADFVRGFSRQIDEEHVLVSMGSEPAIDSMWLFSICLLDGSSVFEGVGRVVGTLPGRDAQGRVTARLAVVWLDHESAAMHQELLRARPAPDLARGTGGPFKPSTLPLPAPPLRGFDDDDDDGIDAATHFYARQHLPLPLVAEPEAPAPKAPSPPPAPAPLIADAAEPALPALEPVAPEVAQGTTGWLLALALVVAGAAAAFSLVAFWC